MSFSVAFFSCLSSTRQLLAVAYTTLVLLPLSFCELHTFLLLSHIVYDILRLAPSYLFCSQLFFLACLVLFASPFHHSLLSVAQGHFTLDVSARWSFPALLLELLTLQTQHFSICIYSLVSCVSLHLNGLYLWPLKRYWSMWGPCFTFVKHFFPLSLFQILETLLVSTMLGQPVFPLYYCFLCFCSYLCHLSSSKVILAFKDSHKFLIHNFS